MCCNLFIGVMESGGRVGIVSNLVCWPFLANLAVTLRRLVSSNCIGIRGYIRGLEASTDVGKVI